MLYKDADLTRIEPRSVLVLAKKRSPPRDDSTRNPHWHSFPGPQVAVTVLFPSTQSLRIQPRAGESHTRGIIVVVNTLKVGEDTDVEAISDIVLRPRHPG